MTRVFETGVVREAISALVGRARGSIMQSSFQVIYEQRCKTIQNDLGHICMRKNALPTCWSCNSAFKWRMAVRNWVLRYVELSYLISVMDIEYRLCDGCLVGIVSFICEIWFMYTQFSLYLGDAIQRQRAKKINI